MVLLQQVRQDSTTFILHENWSAALAANDIALVFLEEALPTTSKIRFP